MVELLAAGVLGAVLAMVSMPLWRIAAREAGPKDWEAEHLQPFLPEVVLTTAQAFGGYAIAVTPSHQVVYCSTAAEPLPCFAGTELSHPLLRALVDEAWTDGEPLTRRVHLTDLAPIEQAEVRATRVADRYVLITLADLTEMGRVEAIRHDFVSNIGHELRTPITAVDLIASTLEVAADDPEAVRHFAGRLTAEARRMGRLTEDVLALAKAQDRDAAHFEAVDLADAVDQAVERQRTASESKSITLSVTHRARPTVWGDSQALVTAVENLISNAINYSPSGSKVAVALTLDRPGAQAVTTVADNGIGIEPSDQERIFERFYRADQARSRRTGGTGLGLAIVKNTMAGHRGAVSVASKPGAGATFTLRLPLYQSKEHLA